MIKKAEEVDVLICGSGSAGLCAAVWLAQYGIRCKILEKCSGPMKIGQADGVQCRTVEIFESLGISEELLRESYHVLEVTFWGSDGKGGILRTSRTPDTEPGLSHLPHVILNQARVNELLLSTMKKLNRQEVTYGYEVESVEVDDQVGKHSDKFPVTVIAQTETGKETFKAQYVLACDGAHSNVRRSLGFKMVGDTSDAVWGVIDLYVRTDFPDIRKKVTVRSDRGNLLIIPREGGSLARFYIELPSGTSAREVTRDSLHKAASRIFCPYSIEVVDTIWWSAFVIGQRLADHFSKADRVFLTGDSCHTHSPKAGQGMNTSLQDGYNIGWKLAQVLRGHASHELLKTYMLEREQVARNLIDFDRYFSKLFSFAGGADGDSPENFSEQFSKSGKYTAGLTAKYADSLITSAARSRQNLARNTVVGMRFPTAQVVRFCDAKAMQLSKALPSDGRWRVVIFAGDIRNCMAAARLDKLGQYLNSADGIVRRSTPEGADDDSVIEVLVVLSGERVQVEQEQIPENFMPVNGKWRLRDLHKVFFDDESYNSGHGRAYEKYGVDADAGAVVIVRPDQYISMVTSIEDHAAIGCFFKCLRLPKHCSGNHHL